MNRPNFEDYKWKYKTQWNYDVARYITNIEKYCDELEQSNKSLSNAYDDCLLTLHFWEEESSILKERNFELESKLKGLTGDYEAQADILYETKQELERYKKENNEND